MSEVRRPQLEYARHFLSTEAEDPNMLFMGVGIMDFTPEELRKMISIMGRLLSRKSKKTLIQELEDGERL